MRLLAISDIHGCLEELKLLLNKINYNPTEDKLILLGDYVDRGLYSMDTLFYVDELIKNGAIALIGNHDSMFLDLINNKSLQWALTQKYYYQLGTINTIEQYLELNTEKQNKIVNILNNLQTYYIKDNYIFVHAGINRDLSIDENEFDDLIWIRDEFYNRKAYDNKIVIFGHTPTCNLQGKFEVWYDDRYKDKIGIDCGCVYGGQLCCLDLTNGVEYYVE